MTETNPSHARQEAISCVETIASLVEACTADFDRIDELKEERAEWLEENPGSFLHLNDPRNGGRWAMACPDEADELAELLEQVGSYESREEVERELREMPLCIEVRSGWSHPTGDLTPAEYKIVLSCGGPHCELRGDLDNGSAHGPVRVLYWDASESGELFDISDEQRRALNYFVDIFFE